ncbi:major facilitator superfamily domain-containing protein, partial [Mycena rebaudengoi]
FGVFQQHYGTNQLKGLPLSTVSFIGSLQLCLILLFGCCSGPLFDAGYLKPMIAAGGTLYVFCLLMTSISTEFYQFVLCQGLGVGIAAGFLFSPSMATIGHHFKNRKILAFGIFASCASVGGTVFPIAIRRLFIEVGFAWAVRILAFIVLLCMICGFVCCSTRLPPRKISQIIDFSVCECGDQIPFHLLIQLSRYAPLSYGVMYAVGHGVDEDRAFYSLSILNALSLLGRLVSTIGAQRVGPVNMLIFACAISGILDFLWITSTSTPRILVFNALFGFASGGYVSVFPASVSSLSDNAQNIGLRLGMSLFCTSFFWLAGPPIQGALIRLHGNYLPTAMFSGTTVLLGVMMMGISRHLLAK